MVMPSHANSGTVCILDDDVTICTALETLFQAHGYATYAFTNEAQVLEDAFTRMPVPDVIIADYDLKGPRTGFELVRTLRAAASRHIPSMILTGDMPTTELRKVVAEDCGYIRKPVNIRHIVTRVAALMREAERTPHGDHVSPSRQTKSCRVSRHVYLVDDDQNLLHTMRNMLADAGYSVEKFISAEAFLASHRVRSPSCLVVDYKLPGMSGIELLEQLKNKGQSLPSVVMTGNSDVPLAIRAMRLGASNFLQKPAREREILESIERALDQSRDIANENSKRAETLMVSAMTPRERDVLDLVVLGLHSKEIAAHLKITRRTVEFHRAAIMRRTGATSLSDLIRMVLRAS